MALRSSRNVIQPTSPTSPRSRGALVYPQVSDWVNCVHGYHFDNMDKRHRTRFRLLVAGHVHAVNAAVTGLTALPGTAKPMACIKAMSRFLRHEHVTLPALIEPAQQAVRDALARSDAPVALVVHDWCMIHYATPNPDRYQRSHAADLGYELGTALVVSADAGQPLGPMELRLRTATTTLSTRPTPTANPPGHIDELLDIMNDARSRWNLGKPLVHVIDREADSVDHYRQWSHRGHTFLVRADADRIVRIGGRAVKLKGLTGQPGLSWQSVKDEAGRPRRVNIKGVAGTLWVAEVAVVLDRPAKKRVGGGKRIDVPGVPLPVRLVLSWVLSESGEVLAEWLLFTNAGEEFGAATVACWYAWRWRIETYHKLLKTCGMNAEGWQQGSGEAVAKRLVVASMACLMVWHLQEDRSELGGKLRGVLVRLSGRQMKHRVVSTAPALLAGLEKLLAIDDLLEEYDLEEVLALARRVLPTLFRTG